MKILVLNCGSSSLKYQLIDVDTRTVLTKGLLERIGLPSGIFSYTRKGEKHITECPIPNHTEGLRMVMAALTDPETGVISSITEVGAVGHRFAHGGEYFTKSVQITRDVINKEESLIDLAPLHIPGNIMGAEAINNVMPDVPQVAVFDTAFNLTIEPKNYLYGIPYEYYEQYGIRRYGFHGTSHDFVSARAAEILGKKREDLKIIVCHLGNGASISAVKNGKCVDTSMGLTPLEGLIMGTRCGDIDPAIVEFIANKENLTVSEVNNVMNKKSGVEGMSRVSSDFRDLSKAMDEGNALAKMALEAYTYRVAKYIGSYVAAMNGVDVIAFTAGIGENDGRVRAMVGEYLDYLGCGIDAEKNAIRGEEVIISRPGDKVTVMVVPTNEELAIARQTVALV